MKTRRFFDSVLIFLTAFVWFGFWSARGKTPFCDYTEVFTHLGIHGLSPLYHWVYDFWIKGIHSFSQGEPFWALMAYSSAFFASLNAVLIFLLAQRLPHTQSSEEFSRVYPEARVQRFSGFFAALFFVVSTPVLFSATTVQLHQVNVFLFLGISWLTLQTWKNVSDVRLLLLGLLTGFVLTEYMAAWLILPFQLSIVGYSIWVSSLSTKRLAVIYLLALMVGVSVFLPVLVYYQQSDMYVWRNFETPLQLFRIYWRDHIWSLTKPLPRVGWILVFLSTIMPFAWVAIPKRVQKAHGVRFGSIFLHIILFLTLCLTLFNTPIAPWELLGERQVVLPYAAAAIAFGYLVGYGYILLGFSLLMQRKQDGKAIFRRRIWLGIATALLIIGAAQSVLKVNHRPAKAIRLFVQSSMPDEASSKNLLISGGWIAEMQQPVGESMVDVLDLSKARSTTYREYLASKVSTTRAEGLARISIQAYLTEALKEEGFRDTVLAFNYPNLWMGLGVKALPVPLSYAGVSEIDETVLNQSRRALIELSEEIIPSLRRVNDGSAYHRYAQFALQGLSKTLNNLGVLYHEAGIPDQALECYQQALVCFEDNISAQLNQLTLLETSNPEEAKRLSQELMDRFDRSDVKPNLWSLSYNYGFVFHVQSYVQRGLSWASSGRSLAAQSDFQQATAMGAQQSEINRALASRLLGEAPVPADPFAKQSEDPEINELLQRIQQKIAQGDFAEAEELLKNEKLEAASRQRTILGLYADLMQSKTEDALLKIRTAPIEMQNSSRFLLLRMALEPSMDSDVVEKLENLERNGRLSLEDLQILAEILKAKGNLDGAVGVYQRAFLRNPNHVGLLEKLLNALAQKGDKENLRRYVTVMMELLPSNPLANRFLGMFQIEDGELQLAVDSFRESYRGDPSGDAAINLAWVLLETGDVESAYRFAKEGVEKKPESSDVYHTLGLIELKKGNLEASEAALTKAIELQPSNPLAKLYLAMLYTEKGDKEQARILLDDIKDQVEMMMPIFRERYEELRVGK